MDDGADLRGPVLPKRGADFDVFYRVPPPWEIGRPQRALLEAADGRGLRGRVLDVGCGSGEHALMAAGRGHEAIGVDAAPTAIELARTKGEERGVEARFVLGDALDLPAVLDGRVDTVVDSALFHVFDDEDRASFAASLAAVMERGATYFLLCFSEHAPGSGGPRRVTEAEIRSTFANGWQVDAVTAAQIETTGMSVPAWLATITRV